MPPGQRQQRRKGLDQAPAAANAAIAQPLPRRRAEDVCASPPPPKRLCRTSTSQPSRAQATASSPTAAVQIGHLPLPEKVLQEVLRIFKPNSLMSWEDTVAMLKGLMPEDDPTDYVTEEDHETQGPSLQFLLHTHKMKQVMAEKLRRFAEIEIKKNSLKVNLNELYMQLGLLDLEHSDLMGGFVDAVRLLSDVRDLSSDARCCPVDCMAAKKEKSESGDEPVKDEHTSGAEDTGEAEEEPEEEEEELDESNKDEVEEIPDAP